jgi:hypothetical protein
LISFLMLIYGIKANYGFKKSLIENCYCTRSHEEYGIPCQLCQLVNLSTQATVQTIHINKTRRNLRFGLFNGLLFLQPGFVAVIRRGEADFFFEENAERTETFKSDFSADIGYAKAFIGQEIPGFIDALSRQVLVRGSSIDAGEESMKMESG